MRFKSLFMLLIIAFSQFAEAKTTDAILQAAIDAISIPNGNAIRGNITLPLTGVNDITYSWATSDSTIIKTTEGIGYAGYAKTPAGVVIRQAKDTVVQLTVTGLRGGMTATRTIDVTVKAQKAKDVDVAYLYAYFSGDETRLDDQQLYFAVSKDGVTWDDLNENNPVIKSVLGDLGVRDPYIIRSVEGDRFFLVATDLDIRASKYGGNWGNMSTKGSTSLMIWESTDLVNWSAQRMVDVASSIGAGAAWAPEAIWDAKTGEYLVYWSSRVSTDSYAKNRIYVCKTRDFYTFTKPVVYVESSSTSGNIDASMFKVKDKFYRLIKDETAGNVSLYSSSQLLDYTNTALGNSFTYIQNAELESWKGGYEGPTMFQYINQDKWCALVDEYVASRRGYIPFVSTDIAAANSLHLLTDNTYLMPTGAKHGTIIPISQLEYDSLVNKWAVPAPVENVSITPILKYDFEETLTNVSVVDKSGNGNNATLFGNATYVTDAVKGKVLYLDATAGTYLKFPQGFFDGRGNITISMDIKPNTDAANHFTFTIGKNTYKYMFLRTRPAEIRNAITTLSNAKERAVLKAGAYKGVWVNVKIVMEGHKMSLYLDNKLIQTNNYVRSINDLGKSLLAYLGKSFYNDPYFNGYFDNVQVYNRAMTEAEITSATGLNSILKGENVKVLFNPTNKTLNVSLNQVGSMKYSVNVFDSIGHKIAQKEMGANGLEFSLNMNRYSLGVYIVSITQGNEKISKQFVNI